jgi:general L-amino acid transport system substrate-binding protein
MKKTMLTAASAVLALGAASAQAATLDDVKAKGFLQCGVTTGLPGFSYTDAAGDWQGFDVAICRGMAAAIFGDAKAVRFTPLTAQTRFTALSAGEIDVLSRTTTWTYSRDVDLKFTFAGVNFYDGQGFMVPAALGVKSALELNGASVCIITGTTTELNLADYFRVNNMTYEPVPVADENQARESFQAGRCDVFTTDSSGLAASRANFATPANYIILPEIISKEPLGPLVRHGDDQWADIVRWTLNTMINAEEYGVTSANVDELAKGTDNPEINRLLGTEGTLGEMLGLNKDWAYQIIKQVGNYGEAFDTYLGPNTPLAIERGLNALWTKGGIQYAPPMR